MLRMPFLKGLLLALAVLPPELPAHHSLVNEFDVNRSIELRGKAVRLDWVNPHISLFLEVAREGGGVETWECELGSPNPLIQTGWRKEDLPLGSTISIIANPARDGSRACSSRNLRLEDGTPIFTRYREP